MAKSISDKLKNAGIEASRGTVTYVDPAALTLITDRGHPLYDPRVEEPLDAALIADIAKRGVLQPIICRDNGFEKDGVRPIIQVIAGRRRTRHLIEANLRRKLERQAPMKIPVTFVNGDDIAMLLIALAENAHRKDESVRSLAVKVSAVQKLGCSVEEISTACAMSTKRVQALLTFLNMHASAQKALEEGVIPMGSIDALAEIPREEQESMLAKLKEAGATKNHEIRDAVKTIRNGHTYSAPERKKAWGRRELKVLKAELEFHDKRSKDVTVAIGLIDFILSGSTKALADFDMLKIAIQSTKRQLKKQLDKAEE